MSTPVPIAIALGSNLGDRRAYLVRAIEQLALFISNIRVSSFLDNEPVDVLEPQPRYLNAVVAGETTLDAGQVMTRLQAIERSAGRERRSFHAARTLDLDLILFGGERISTAALTVPHPRYRDREFVLAPLAEVAADWIDPETGKTVGELLAEVRSTK